MAAELGVNALEYFTQPCQCVWCYERPARSTRNWDQFLRFYQTVLGIRGSYTQSAFLNDPEVIEYQVNAPDSEWKSQPPALFRWTAEMDALRDIADQLIAARARDDKVKFYPRPVVPAEKLRKERKARKQSGGIDAAIQRGIDANKWNYL